MFYKGLCARLFAGSEQWARNKQRLQEITGPSQEIVWYIIPHEMDNGCFHTNVYLGIKQKKIWALDFVTV